MSTNSSQIKLTKMGKVQDRRRQKKTVQTSEYPSPRDEDRRVFLLLYSFNTRWLLGKDERSREMWPCSFFKKVYSEGKKIHT